MTIDYSLINTKEQKNKQYLVALPNTPVCLPSSAFSYRFNLKQNLNHCAQLKHKDMQICTPYVSRAFTYVTPVAGRR